MHGLWEVLPADLAEEFFAGASQEFSGVLVEHDETPCGFECVERVADVVEQHGEFFWPWVFGARIPCFFR